ncbi:hypothetical protein CES85_1182 [Ochrobactrum quorumnocens]|uniref:Uncharacterized protein n=1 Tax=Ochrobactrum quorumnocens TaxID=271865 RepID=A0A248UF54_9HYPH|nr:hypothetical protein CES85_1182 [[Ochrobactrum] quorumnocens]
MRRHNSQSDGAAERNALQCFYEKDGANNVIFILKSLRWE